MSNFLATLGSIWFGVSFWGYTKNMALLALGVVVAFGAWKLFIEGFKKDKHGDNNLDW